MDWQADPIASLSSVAYLLGYVVCIVAAVVVVRVATGRADRTRGLQPPLVTTERNPNEVAYLRGDGNELLRFRIFDLVRRGYLQISAAVKGSLERSPAAPGESGLDALDHAIAGFYADGPKTTAQVFKSALPATADAFGRMTYRDGLEREGMYASDAMRSAARQWGFYCGAALLLIAALRFFDAIVRGRHNVGLLILLAFVGIFAVWIASRVPRLSAHGRSFLQRLQTALGPMRVAPALAGGAALPIFVAATGMAALAGTEYASMNTMFRRQATANGGGGGSCNSCGSGGGSDSGAGSCGGGGGCGGGCGG